MTYLSAPDTSSRNRGCLLHGCLGPQQETREAGDQFLMPQQSLQCDQKQKIGGRGPQAPCCPQMSQLLPACCEHIRCFQAIIRSPSCLGVFSEILGYTVLLPSMCTKEPLCLPTKLSQPLTKPGAETLQRACEQVRPSVGPCGENFQQAPHQQPRDGFSHEPLPHLELFPSPK